MLDKITTQLRRDEGEVLHAYKDSLGYLTIGVGRLIDKAKGGGISKEESAYLLKNDIDKKLKELELNLPWVNQLDEARKGVLLNMTFQLGIGGVLLFKNTLTLIKAGEWEKAAMNMRMSKWHEQTPERCERLCKQIITGEWQ